MSYLVIARKYRPGSFASVTGQEHVTRTLAHSIARDRIGHAYLFSGPRGVGKTSIARIFARCLNCETGPTDSPCGECKACKQIEQGSSLAVREIDGASHNSVDNVRELIESFRSAPPPGFRYKVYIIDEVHMFSIAAFNALLKSLEEPPPHTVFILATTEPHKIPQTVISRCQRYDFRSMTVGQIESCLKTIADKEGLSVEEGVLQVIARCADGSMRDAQSLLEQVRSFCEKEISLEDAVQVLGVVDSRLLLSMTEAVFNREPKKVVGLFQEALSSGIDIAIFLKEFVAHWRALQLVKFCDRKALSSAGIQESEWERLEAVVSPVSVNDFQDLIQLAREGADLALRSAFPEVAIEALLVMMSTRVPSRDIAELISYVRTVHAKSGGTAKSDNRATPSGSSRRATGSSPARPAGNASAAETKSGRGGRQPGKPLPEEEVSNGEDEALNWEAFVSFVKENTTQQMLAAYMIMLSPVTFKKGRLHALGPDLATTYFVREDKKQHLLDLLEQFSDTKNWQIVIEAGANKGAPEKGSVLEKSRRNKRLEQETKNRSLQSHPQVQSLKKAFPGSTIEAVAVRPEKNKTKNLKTKTGG